MNEDNEDIYVMADSHIPITPSVKPTKVSFKIIGLTTIITILGGMLVYLVMAKSPTSQQPSSNVANKESISNSTTRLLPKSPVDNSQTQTGSFETVKEKLIINFASNSVELTASENSKIKTFWSEIKQEKGMVIIEGHADDLGSEEYNQELSKDRAEQVVKVLQRIGMDDRYTVTVQGFGETKPLANNTTKEGRALNRRAVINFVAKK